ncbi:unnamed protein product, partial [Candidula unifasciata]
LLVIGPPLTACLCLFSLLAAELKEWTLVMMGSSTHHTKRNGTPASSDDNVHKSQPLPCLGIVTNSICI